MIGGDRPEEALQLTIPGVPRPGAARPHEPAPEPASPTAEADPRQLALFSDHAILSRDLEGALQQGDFEHAAQIRMRMEETFGPGASAGYAFLEHLTAGFHGERIDGALAGWRAAAEELAPHPGLERQVRRAFFRRVAGTWGGEAVAATAPAHLADVVNAMAVDPGGRRAGRRLVRDALLEGRPLLPGGFEDAAVVEILAEDRPPPWLACLGAVRRVWPATAGRERGAPPAPPVGAGQARRFWYWLAVAESSGSTLEQVYEARAHLKRLDAELHALYMRRAPRRGPGDAPALHPESR
jgi:hypothetical protein